MNIKLLKLTLHSDTEAYLERIGHNSATILDHICTNIADDSFNSGIIVSDISDHFPVFYIRNFKDKFDSDSIFKLKKLLEDKNWETVLLNRDKDSASNNFFESMDNCSESSFLEKNVNPSRKKRPFNPWMSEALIISRKRKVKLFNKS